MQEVITYDPQGTGENYGVQYHGEDLSKLIKAIHHLVHTKGMPLPLPSHHGLSIKLKQYSGFRLCILASSLNEDLGIQRHATPSLFFQVVVASPCWSLTTAGLLVFWEIRLNLVN